MTQQKLKLDKKAVEKINNEIATLKKELMNLTQEQGNISKRLPLDNWFMSTEMQSLSNDILVKQERLHQLECLEYEIIEELNKEGAVDINRTYKLHLEYANGKDIERLFTLVSGLPDPTPENGITQISISSPLGSAILGKEIGTTQTFKTQIGNCNVTIIEEVYEETAETV